MAAGKAQVLRDAIDEEVAAGGGAGGAGESEGGEHGDDDARKTELQELDERVATASKVGVFFLY